MTLKLIIAIPTYKRPDALSRLLSSIARQTSVQYLAVNIIILDNDPQASGREAAMAHAKACEVRGWKLSYRANCRNIGAEANIAKAYLSHPYDASLSYTYVWTIGDDDVLETDAFAKASCALSEEMKPPLVITSRSQSTRSRFHLIGNTHQTYGDFMRKVSVAYPELPIHHTLISCNIVRAGVFDLGIWKKRIGSRYAQMYAIMGELRRLHEQGEFSEVRLVPDCLANEPTLPFQMDDHTTPAIYQEIPFRWAEYFCWLRRLWQIDPNEYDLRAALRSDFWK